MSLSKRQDKILDDAMKYEKEGVKEFFASYLDESDKLIELDNHEEKVISLFVKLYHDDCKQQTLLKVFKEKKHDFLEELQSKTFEDIADAEVQSEDLFGMNHVNFEWTEKILKKSKKIAAATKIQSRVRGNKSRFTSQSLGYMTTKQKTKNWPKVKQDMIKEMIEDDMSDTEKQDALQQIEDFKEVYMKRASMKKKSKKKKKSKNKKKKSSKKKKSTKKKKK